MPKASIIIPCYNAASYISDTLVSARNQTVTDIEIICVDDGSTDDTLSILQAQAAEDPRIRVFHQRNAGEGPAREAGRRQATGDWLAFLDADDFFEPTAVEEAVACGEREHADVVIFRTRLSTTSQESYLSVIGPSGITGLMEWFLALGTIRAACLTRFRIGRALRCSDAHSSISRACSSSPSIGRQTCCLLAAR